MWVNARRNGGRFKVQNEARMVFSLLLRCCVMLVFKKREVLGNQSKGQDACGEDTDGDGNFGQGRPVMYMACS